MALSYKDLLQKSSLIKKIVMVSLGKGDSSCTLVNWFIAKFCMFFTGRHGQTKTSLDICQFFLFNPRQILSERIVFWICFCLPCFPFGAVQSIPASRSINCANLQSIPSFVRCYQFQVPVWFPAISRFPGFRLIPVFQFHRLGVQGLDLPVSSDCKLRLSDKF